MAALVTYLRGAIGLVIVVVIATLLNIRIVRFAARPRHIVYLAAYLVVMIGTVGILWSTHPRHEPCRQASALTGSLPSVACGSGGCGLLLRCSRPGEAPVPGGRTGPRTGRARTHAPHCRPLRPADRAPVRDHRDVQVVPDVGRHARPRAAGAPAPRSSSPGSSPAG